MIREVEEETGLRVVPKSVATIDTIVNRSGDCEFHGIRILYEVEVLGGSLRSESSGTTDLCQWHPLHPTPDIDLVDLAKVGLLHAQKHPTDPASVVSE